MIIENAILANISNKLSFYIDKNGISLINLAKEMNVPYQPIYRTYKKLNMPSFDLIVMISKYLDCTYEELISEAIFIDIPAIDNIDLFKGEFDSCKIYRIYANYNDRDLFLKNQIVGLIKNEETTDVAIMHLYKKLNQFDKTGQYIVEYKGKCKEYLIVGIRKTTLYFNENDMEKQIDINEVKAIAFNCGKVVCFEYPNIMQGVRIK